MMKCGCFVFFYCFNTLVEMINIELFISNKKTGRTPSGFVVYQLNELILSSHRVGDFQLAVLGNCNWKLKRAGVLLVPVCR